jgi:two-component system, OmpR family, phosphate regulon response regulator PhoB
MDKKRILIVDDEAGAARLLKASLELTNRYEVRIENWPEDAAATARQFKPDLVLLDIIMPRMPGGNVAEAFGLDPELKRTPIVFLTAAVRRHQVEDHEGTICDHPCLAKPASVQEIIQCIEANLPRPEGAALSAPAPGPEEPPRPQP